jgi:hypothetical protein
MTLSTQSTQIFLNALIARKPWALDYLEKRPDMAKYIPEVRDVVAEINADNALRPFAGVNPYYSVEELPGGKRVYKELPPVTTSLGETGRNVGAAREVSASKQPERSPPPTSLGASGTNISNVNQNLGSLGNINVQSYIDLVKEQVGTRPDTNPWLTALQFFTNMAAEASKPGATALGAAGTAGATTVDTLLEGRKQERAEKLAATQMGLTLAASLGKRKTTVKFDKGEEALYMSEEDAKDAYPPSQYSDFWRKFSTTNTNLIGKPIKSSSGRPQIVKRKYENGVLVGGSSTLVPGVKPAAIDAGESQDRLIYRTEADAKKYLENKGLPEDSPEFANLVARMVPKKGYEALLGRPVVSGDTYEGISFITKGNVIIGANVGPMKGAAEPRILTWAKKELSELAKNDNYIEQTFNVLPQVDRGLKILLSEGTITGKWQEFTLPFRALLADMFKLEKGPIIKQQLIQSISNVLAPKMRPKGSGSTSDMEFKAYRQAIADLGNTTLANYLTMYTFKRVAENSRDASAAKAIAIADGAGPKEVKTILDDMDKKPGGSIYARFADDPELTTKENDARFAEFLNTRERGEVIYNYDKTTGGKLIDVDSQGIEMPDFIVSNGQGSYISFR